jgi:Pyruvate/2-oxoacid:ferredoxin oxidoreductase delta subunit
LSTYKASHLFPLQIKQAEDIPLPSLFEFRIRGNWNTLPLSAVGEYPRRVNLGESLFEKDSFKIVSPINGIARYNLDSNEVVLESDGYFFPKPIQNLRSYTKESLLERLNLFGVISLDFGKTLEDLFKPFQSSRESFIIFSPITRENQIDFSEILFKQFKEELVHFKKAISQIFPESNTIDYLTQNKIEFEYPEGIPSYFLSKYLGIELKSSFPHENFLYLGPETIYHMIRAMYQEISFHERHIGFGLLEQDDEIKIQHKHFLLKNGTNLSETLSKYKEEYSYYCLNSYFDADEIYSIDTELILDIYKHKSILLVKQFQEEKKESECIDCNKCDLFCPVNAEPRSLLDKNSNRFKKDICFECGICSLVCPSDIDLKSLIQKVK